MAGKETDAYRREVSSLYMNPRDMDKLGIKEGDHVLVRSNKKTVELTAMRAIEDLKEGVAYLPIGQKASELCSAETNSVGMPLLKGVEVEILEV